MFSHLSSHTQMLIVIGIVVAWHLDLWITIAVLAYQSSKVHRELVKQCKQNYDAFLRAHQILKGEVTL